MSAIRQHCNYRWDPGSMSSRNELDITTFSRNLCKESYQHHASSFWGTGANGSTSEGVFSTSGALLHCLMRTSYKQGLQFDQGSLLKTPPGSMVLDHAARTQPPRQPPPRQQACLSILFCSLKFNLIDSFDFQVLSSSISCLHFVDLA